MFDTAEAEFIWNEKIQTCTSNVNDNWAARKEYSIVLAAHDN